MCRPMNWFAMLEECVARGLFPNALLPNAMTLLLENGQALDVIKFPDPRAQRLNQGGAVSGFARVSRGRDVG
jgi:hypothetical protein